MSCKQVCASAQTEFNSKCMIISVYAYQIFGCNADLKRMSYELHACSTRNVPRADHGADFGPVASTGRQARVRALSDGEPNVIMDFRPFTLNPTVPPPQVPPFRTPVTPQKKIQKRRRRRFLSAQVPNLNMEIWMQLLKDVMSYDVQVISPEATIREAAARMRDEGFGMLPVGENDRMIGAISDRDIAMRAVADGKGADTLVRDVMSEDMIWCYEDDTVEKGADVMSSCQVRRLPVVNREKRLVGIVSLGDFAVAGDDIRPCVDALIGISQPQF